MNNVAQYDLIIIGGPIYAGNVPEKLIKWVLRTIPKSTTGKAILFTTSAGLLNANGTISLAKKLSKKGYSILGLLKYKLPRNYYFDKYERPTEEEIVQLFKDVKNLIPEDLNKLSNSKGLEISQRVLGMDLLAETMSIMTRFMGKSFSVNNNCTKCKKCVNSCPTNNIVLKETISFKLHCMMCTRCIHSCPENAIEYKGKKVIQYKYKNQQ